MSIFTDSAKDACMSSVHDLTFEQSDMDSSTSDRSADEDPPKDYWFGQKYFECVIAQSILRNSRLYESTARVDSRLEQGIQKFPYAQSLTELQAQGLGPLMPLDQTNLEHEAYRVMIHSIGAIVRKGDRGQRATLLAILRRNGATLEGPDLDYMQPHDIYKGASVGRQQQQQQRVQQHIDDVDVFLTETGRYATALKEYSDRRGQVPKYSVAELSRTPPSFQAVVMIGESTHVGTAKNKKRARHEAAKEACLEMGIEP